MVPKITLVVALIAALSAEARASRAPAAFLGLQALGLSEDQTQQLERALDARLRRDRRFAFSSAPERAALMERCHGDRACLCREARRAAPAATHLLYANVGRIDPLFTFELVLVRAAGCVVADSLFISEMHDPVSARQRIGQLAGKLLKPRESVSETVVKAERDVDRAPAVVTVASAEQIERLGITRLTELVRLVPGFEVVDTNWGDIVLHQGLTSTVLYMIDGVPLSNPRMYFNTLGRDGHFGINHVERVEFVRGPGSVLWGQNAFLGIINLITRLPPEKGERVRAHLRLGTLDTQEVFVGLEGNRNWFAYHLSATWGRSRGAQTRVGNSMWADLGVAQPVWGNAGTTDNGADTYLNVITRVRVAGKLELRIQYLKNFSYFELSSFGSLLPADDRGWWDAANLIYALSWEDALPRGFRYRLSASRYEHHSFENFIVHPKNPAVLPYGFSALQGNELRPEVNHLIEGRIYHTLGRERWTNQALLGLAYLHQAMPDQYITFTTGQARGTEELDMAANAFNTVSVFLQDDLSLLSDRLVLSAGLRYDWHHPFKSAISTQGAVIGGIDALFAKLVYTEGFRPPELNNLYSTKGVKGNPELRPERSRALALEVVGKPWEPLALRAGGTVAWLTDLIRQELITGDPTFTTKPMNKAATNVYAAYGQVQLAMSRFDLFAGYAYKRLTEDPPSTYGLPVAPHTFSAGASLRLFDHFTAFTTASVVSPRTVHVMQAGRTDPVEQRIKTHVLVDFGLTISDLLGMFDLTVKACNPARYVNRSPYRFDGRATTLLERRQVSEVLFTLGWSGRSPWSGAGDAPRRRDEPRPATKEAPAGGAKGEGARPEQPEQPLPAEPAAPLEQP